MQMIERLLMAVGIVVLLALCFFSAQQQSTISQLTDRVVVQEETIDALEGFLTDIAKRQGQQAVDISRHAEILSDVAGKANATADGIKALSTREDKHYKHFLTGRYQR
jgi:ABC-type uncharacterized transport system ATPase subunit